MRGRLTIACPVCSRSFHPKGVSANGERLVVHCSQCGVELEIPQLSSPQPPTSQGEPTCPKCSEQRKEGAVACAKCGLVFKKWSGPQELFGQREHLKKQWEHVRTLSMDDSGHFDFLERCFKEGRLNDAVQAYKALGASHNIDVADKIRQLEILAQMSVTKRPRPNLRKRTWLLLFMLALFLLATAALWSITPEDLLG